MTGDYTAEQLGSSLPDLGAVFEIQLCVISASLSVLCGKKPTTCKLQRPQRNAEITQRNFRIETPPGFIGINM